MLRPACRPRDGHARAHRACARRGVTLVELVVALTLAGIVAAAVVRSRATSQGAAHDALAATEGRRQLRAGTGAVLATLRGISPEGGDLLALADSVLDLRVTLGASITCAVSPGALDTPPSVTIVAPGGEGTPLDGLAGWNDAPASGDRLLVLARDSGALATWRWHSLAVAAAGAPSRTTCFGAADVPTLRVPLAATPPAAIVAGAPVRLLRRGRWSVYRSGGRWYLGWRDAAASGIGLDAVQPVSGPYDRRDASGAWRAALAFGRVPAFADSGAGLAGIAVHAATPVVRGGRTAAESMAVVAAFRNRGSP